MSKKKPKKEEEAEDEFTKLTGAELIANLKLRKDKVNDLRIKRNYIQQDRDKVQQFYQNTIKQIQEINTQIINKESEMEELESTHRVDVKVYLQRVKHLQYELQRADIEIQKDGNQAKALEKAYFQKWTNKMRMQKKALKEKYNVNEREYINLSAELVRGEMMTEQMNQTQNDKTLAQLEQKYKQRHEKLIEDLQLKLKVEQHQLQQRKNLHINELVKNHEVAFANLKSYENDITSDNLKLIKQHKAQIEMLKQQAARNKKLIEQMRNSNKKEKEPLQKQKKKKAEKLVKLKYFDKQKNSLYNYQSKLRVLNEKKLILQKDSKTLDEEIEKLQKTMDQFIPKSFEEQLEKQSKTFAKSQKDFQRDDTQKANIISKFNRMISEVKRHGQLKNNILKQRLKSLTEKIQNKVEHIKDTIQHTPIDPNLVNQITNRVQRAIQEKNYLIKSTQYSIHHATKAYNDAIRVYQTKLVEFGIPEEQLGFQSLETITSTMPAGLVSS